jgi:hypothetical protein
VARSWRRPLTHLTHHVTHHRTSCLGLTVSPSYTLNILLFSLSKVLVAQPRYYLPLTTYHLLLKVLVAQPRYYLPLTTYHLLLKVLVAQPRRVAAISLAQRVAAERGEAVGRTVGYP